MSKETANVLNELYRLHEENNGLTPLVVIKAAKPKDSVLHNQFEWDNKKAGDSWRLHQARQLIRKLTVIVDDKPQHAFYHIGKADIEEDNRYMRTEAVVANIDLYERALSELQRKIAGIQKSAEELRRLAKDKMPEQQVVIDALIQSLRTAENIAQRLPH